MAKRWSLRLLRWAAELWDEILDKEGHQEMAAPVPFGGPAPAAEPTPAPVPAEEVIEPRTSPFTEVVEASPKEEDDDLPVFSAAEEDELEAESNLGFSLPGNVG